MLGHFNGDSNLDLAEINVNFYKPDQYVYVFPGQGDGTFNAAQAAFGANIPGAVAAGDFNGDGLLDLAVSEAQAHTVNLIFGLADGGFRQGDDGGLAPGSQIWNGNDNAVRMIAAPLDNPVRSELVMINSNAIDHNIGVMRHVDAGVVIDDYAALDPTHVALGDFNGDHQLDIAFLVDAGSISQLKLLIGKGDGTFQDAKVDPVSLASTGLAVADLNGDGFADAVILQPNANGGTVVIWTGQPDAGLSFLPPTLSIASDPVATTFPAWVGASDLNGDGVQDLLVMHACSANCSAPHTFMSVLLGQGDGGFGSEIPYQGLASSNLAAIADLNHDGKPDLLFLSDTSQFEVLLQSGCGP